LGRTDVLKASSSRATFGRRLEQAEYDLDIGLALKWVAASDETRLGTDDLDDALRRRRRPPPASLRDAASEARRYMVAAPRDALADVEPRNLWDHVVAAAQAVVDDLAHGRIASKQLANTHSRAT